MHIARIGPDGAYHTRMLRPPDLRAVQALFESARDYFEIATGAPPAPDEAARAFVAGPPTKAVDDKRTIGIFAGRDLIGVLDAVTDWPGAREWTMGMLLLHPQHRGHGLGAEVLGAYEAWAASQGAGRLRTAVVSHHVRAARFLERHGYQREPAPGTDRVAERPAAVLHFAKHAP